MVRERTDALAEPIERARRAPEIIAGVRRDAERLRTRIPHARETVSRLAERYSAAALGQVADNAAEADQLRHRLERHLSAQTSGALPRGRRSLRF